jgi:HAD superfamily hydrolase (TIGR01459 family)
MTRVPRSMLSGLATIAERYDGFVFDVWGTVYAGEKVFDGVLDVFKGLRRLGKRVVFLSNSPQLPSVVASRLEKIGIKSEYHDGIVTSGGETHHQLSTAALPEIQAFQGRVYLTGPDRFPDTLPVGMVPITKNIKDAEWILNAGPNHPPETLEDYLPLLRDGAARGVPMLCANPDKTVFHGTELHICAGVLAEHYTVLGGDVHYIGKPHEAVFARCQKTLGITKSNRILMVGDNLETDILGANRFGCHSLLVSSGVHALLDRGNRVNLSRLDELESAFGARGDYVIDNLRW